MKFPDRTLYIGYRKDIPPRFGATDQPFAKVDWFADTDTYVYTLLTPEDWEGQHSPYREGFTQQGSFSFFTARLMNRGKAQFPLFPLVLVEGQGPEYTRSYDKYLAQFGCTRETYHPFDELDWHHGRRVTDSYYFSLDAGYWD